MDALDQVAGWPVPHASVGLVAFGTSPDGPALAGAQCLGVAGATDRVYPWASVTKPVTALAVLIAFEEGTVSLDEPAGPPGATVRHLLAHASGLGPEPGSPTVAPGTRRIYSNAGYLVLADLVAERAGMPFADYCGQAVLEPLGLAGTGFDPEAPSGAAAAGLSGPLDDLLALGAELAAPTLVSAQTHRDSVSVQYPGLAGVLPGFGRFEPCDWGLGVEIRGDKQPHWTGTANGPQTFGHFGRSGSFLWIDPGAGLIGAGLCDRPFGPWAARAWPALADAALAERGGGAAVGRPGDPRSRLRRMKGVILAGGTGSRLHPLTRITNKHLLPIYDRPMINWGIEALVNAGITEIMLVTGGTHAGEFLRLLGNGHEFGIDRLSYGYQDRPGGIAEALGLAARFVDGDPVLVMLADNIVERSIKPMVDAFVAQPHGARILLTPVEEDEHLRHLGVPTFDDEQRVVGIVEKPEQPASKFGVTGIYCYDADVFEVIPDLVPSGRGELEITDVNNHYIGQGTMAYDVLEGFWGDAGESIDAYYAVNDFVRTHGANKG